MTKEKVRRVFVRSGYDIRVLIAVALLMLSVLTGSVLYFFYRSEVVTSELLLKDEGALLVRLGIGRGISEPATLTSDVAFLSRERFLQEWLAREDARTRAAVETQFLAFLTQKDHYDQVRFIDDRGMERIRVDRRLGQPAVVPPDELQDKVHRPYVVEALSLGPGEAYVSSLGPNMEHGVVERPLKPVLRLAMPVYDGNDIKRGIVVLNYRANVLFEKLKNLSRQATGNMWLLDGRGMQLLERENHTVWSIDTSEEDPVSFADSHPSVWEKILESPGWGQFVDRGHLYTFAATGLDKLTKPTAMIQPRFEHGVPDKTLILVERVPAEALASHRWQAAMRFGVIAGALIVLEMFCAWLAYRFWAGRRAADEIIRQSEESFRAMFAVAPDAVLLTDRRGTIVQANDQATKLFGYDHDTLIGMPVDNLVPTSVRRDHGALRAGYFEKSEIRQLGAGRQLWAVRRDGTEFPADIRLSRVVDRGEDVVFASIRDMTERHEKERTIAEMAERLSRDNKALVAANAELDGFSYSVSHDLRAPLRSMNGFCEALSEDYGDRLDDTGRDYLRRITEAATRMGRLIDDLLELSRVSRKEMRTATVSLSDLVAKVAEQLRMGDPNRDVTFRIQPGIAVIGDENLLHAALENLIGNAWKYTAKTPRAVVEFGVSSNGEGPVYFVRDNGVGFDMTYADKIFEPFQRLNNAAGFEGTGIGLASVANIVRRHGGGIWAESKTGAGTTMHFTLPGNGASLGYGAEIGDGRVHHGQ